MGAGFCSKSPKMRRWLSGGQFHAVALNLDVLNASPGPSQVSPRPCAPSASRARPYGSIAIVVRGSMYRTNSMMVGWSGGASK